MEDKVFDTIIIGAGVVGVAIFNKLTRVGKHCLIIDKASDVATGASKANSGLIHAGYDPKPDSLKAKFNVRGNKLYPAICKRLSIKLVKCGALVLGDDEQKVKELFDRAQKNGVYAEIWHRAQIKEKISNVAEHIKVALFARDAYIISPYLFTIALTDEGILNGGQVELEQDIFSIKKEGEIFVVTTQKGVYKAKSIVNSSGSGYNEIAKLLGAEEYPLVFRRGEYFVFDKVQDFQLPCTLFPMPTAKGKGVLVTPTIDGNYLVGPTSEDDENITKTTFKGLEEIKEKSKNILTNINFKNAIREFAGVRVICGDDFIVEKSKKVQGVINLAGICSPGLTSAPAIAEEVVKLLGYSLKEKSHLKKIQPYKLLKDMSVAEQKKLCEEDKNYCQIVCKCEQITKGDIIFALNRPLKISSVDGIKRRTNAGMGRCQGGFCFTKVVKEIAKSRKIDYCKVKKENRGSEIGIGDIREVNRD